MFGIFSQSSGRRGGGRGGVAAGWGQGWSRGGFTMSGPVVVPVGEVITASVCCVLF